MPRLRVASVLVAAVLACAACGGGASAVRTGTPGGPAGAATGSVAGSPAGATGSVAGSPAGATATTGSAGLAALEALVTKPEGATEQAKVVRVVDGDTIIVDRGHGKERVRYIGMDTPESVKPDTPVQFMAKEASAENARLVEGQTVILEKDVSDRDRYDRLLRYVWVEDPSQPDGLLLVNLALVARGFAQVATFPPDVRYVDVYRQAERAARDQGLALWGPATPAP